MKESIQQYLLLHTQKTTDEISEYLFGGKTNIFNISRTRSLLLELLNENKIYSKEVRTNHHVWMLVDGVIIA